MSGWKRMAPVLPAWPCRWRLMYEGRAFAPSNRYRMMLIVSGGLWGCWLVCMVFGGVWWCYYRWRLHRDRLCERSRSALAVDEWAPTGLSLHFSCRRWCAGSFAKNGCRRALSVRMVRHTVRQHGTVVCISAPDPISYPVWCAWRVRIPASCESDRTAAGGLACRWWRIDGAACSCPARTARWKTSRPSPACHSGSTWTVFA